MAGPRLIVMALAATVLATGAAAQPMQRGTAEHTGRVKPRTASPLDRGERLMEEGRYAEAEAELRSLLAAGGLSDEDTLRARLRLVESLLALDRPADAEPFVVEALTAAGPGHALRGWAIGAAVDVYMGLDRPGEALPLMEEDLALSRANGPDAEARALSRLGTTLTLAGRYRESTDRLTEALALMGDHTEPRLRLATLSQLGRTLDLQGRHAEARPQLELALNLARETMGAESMAAAGAMNDLGTHLSDTGEYERADELLRLALALLEQLSGPRSPATAAALTNVGNVYLNAGRWAAAEPYYRRAAAINAERDSAVDLAIDLTNLGWVVHKQGRAIEAEGILSRSLSLFEGSLGLEHPYTATARTNLAGALRVQGRCEEAAPMFREVSRVYALFIDDRNPLWPFTMNGLAACLAETGGNPAEIEDLFRAALDISWSGLPPGHPYGLEPANDFAHWLIGQGRADEARDLLERAGGALIDRTAARAASERTAQAELAQFRTLFQLRVDAAWALAERER